MSKRYLTGQPFIVSIDSEPEPSTSSFGRWAVGYSIKWNLTDKNAIGTLVFFWSKKEAIEWINKHKV